MINRLFFCFSFLLFASLLYTQSQFVRVDNHQFTVGEKPYVFSGTNYWYGGFLAYDSVHNGKQRLREELDFLVDQGVTNLRVMASAEGDNTYPYRIYPSLQPKSLVYNEALLQSFDYFLVEAGKRQLKIVMVLSNNWEWSGGFGQYLEWAGEKEIILPKTPSWDWDKYCGFITKFYSCDSCQYWYRAWIKHIVTRRNTLTGIYYTQDPTIMTWELANEPRPMRKEEIVPYKNWIKETSLYIRSLDSHHLITTGVEGIIGTAMDSSIFQAIHQLPSIDYATIHLWPKTWQWYNGTDSHATSDTSLAKSTQYIQTHSRWMKELQKPLVIEEFGLHRDGNRFDAKAKTTHRDKYYQHIFSIGKANRVAGYNFWGAFAQRDKSLLVDFWQQGHPYTADPPQEEQGLYGVYKTDSSTWRVICSFGIR